MKLLIVLTYYRPHISGLTIYAERLAKAMVKRGHQVTVLTSRYLPELASYEVQSGVKIVRAPVAFRLSKGVIMPTFGMLANSLVAEHDAIQLHLPQFDAAGVALRGRLLKKPTVITYHCDLLMPPGLLALTANLAVKVMNNLAALTTNRIVTYTRDYAENSPYLRRYMHKLQVIPPPVELPAIRPEAISSFAMQHNPYGRKPVIGMAGRFATEKGIEVLLNALPRILQSFPNAQVQFAGPYQNIIGEEHYFKRLSPRIEEYQAKGSWQFVGSLNPEQIAAFYPNLDLFVFPSLNSTESFGLVQIEGMINGVPSVVSNLPGVRQPVTLHEMGKIFSIGDSNALADAALEVLNHRQDYVRPAGPIIERYQPDSIAAAYEKLFDEINRDL